MKKILFAALAVLLVAPAAIASPASSEEESKSTPPVVAAVSAGYYRQMEAERASRDAIRAAVEKHQADVAKAKALTKKKAEAKKKAVAKAAEQRRVRAAQIAAQKKAEARRIQYAQRQAKPITKPVTKKISASGFRVYALNAVGPTQFVCLDLLWKRESGWNYRAANPSGAYGIPQALPGSKMASAGSDWRTNPITQINWGLSYIKGRYGTPCNAWSHSQSVGWY